MFDVIIRYSQQVTEDSWERRCKSVRMSIPGLEKYLAELDGLTSPRVVDVQPVNSEENGTQPTSSNSDYTAVLEAGLKEYYQNKSGGYACTVAFHEIAAHLNSFLQNQNCA